MKSFANQYLEILNGELKGLNLTRITSEEDFFVKQIVDSIEPLNQCPQFKKSLECQLPLIDVGFGGGFPLLPLAKLYPDKTFIGLEARKKKAEAVMLIAERLNIKNVQTYHQRLEEVEFDRPSILTFKAVSDIEKLLPMICGQEIQRAYFYKGPKCDDKENFRNKMNGWTKFSDKEYELEKTNGRRVLGFKGVSVPRGTNLNKPLVKLSNLI
jgi:16S rRNA (guanine527-N7)-methyltransferase